MNPTQYSPTQYSENGLPKIESSAVASSSKKYIVNDVEQYNLFKKNFVKFIGSDCWAIVVNDEILCNRYKDKTVKEQIQENLIHSSIMNEPHLLFHDAFQKKKDIRVILYMFNESPEFIVCNYNFLTDSLTLDHMVNIISYAESYENVEKTIQNASRKYNPRMLVNEDSEDSHDKYFFFKQEQEVQTTSTREEYNSLKSQIHHLIPNKKGYYDYVAKKGYDSLVQWATENGKTMDDIMYGRNDIYVRSDSHIRKAMTLNELVDDLKNN